MQALSSYRSDSFQFFAYCFDVLGDGILVDIEDFGDINDSEEVRILKEEDFTLPGGEVKAVKDGIKFIDSGQFYDIFRLHSYFLFLVTVILPFFFPSFPPPKA